MTINLNWLKEKGACSEAIEEFKEKWPKKIDGVKAVKKLKKADNFGWANWLVVRLMKRKQYIAYAVFAAEQVIDIFEKKYPDDDRPRKAIEAAKKCINDDSLAAAAYAGAYADAAAYAGAYAAAGADADAAADAAAYAAAGAAAAAYAAAGAAAYAAAYADAAADAAAGAYADAAAYAARKKMQIKILNYGIKLLED